MIIIHLVGGLGNQIFQYCFARSLSLDLNKELYIDLSFFNHRAKRHEIYGLNSFDIKGIVGNYSFIHINSLLFKLIYYIGNFSVINKIPLMKLICYYLENDVGYNIKFNFKEPNIFISDGIEYNNLYDFNNIETPAYFGGTFQFHIDSKNRLFVSEKFFRKYNKIIHEDLEYLPKLTSESQKIINDMDKSNSVLLHVRHGDYVGLHDFGLCSEEYYENSIEIMASKIENPKFFIFSDDIEGAKKLKINYPHEFVDFKENNELNARGNVELLKLMSSCKHFIIANSSLSWWAAFLSKNEDKIIITPKPWFQSRRVIGVESIDLINPVEVTNNNSRLFNESKHKICELNDGDFTFNKIDFDKNENEYMLKNIKKDSSIILNNKIKTSGRLIVKIALKSNCFNCFKILFKTKDNKRYCEGNTFNLYYYEDDDFEQYFLFPKDAILDGLKIKPAASVKDNNDLVIKSLEIRGIR